MIIDPGILLITSPYRRQIHFWAKASIWKSKIFGFIFDGLGCVPVRRKLDDVGGYEKKLPANNEHLWKATINVLRLNELIGIFPEGTSYSLPHHIVFRDGLAKAALEYSKLCNKHGFPNAPIIPISITYLEKEKWRTMAIVMYGKPINVAPFIGQSSSLLTKYLENSFREISINAPDWETFYVAKLARKLLIPYETLELDDFVPLSQAFITVFSNLQHHPVISRVFTACLDYFSALKLAKMQDDVVMFSSRSMWSHPLFWRSLTTLLTKAPLLLPGFLFLWPLFLLRWYLGRNELYAECRSQTRCLTIFGFLPTLIFLLSCLGYFYGCLSWVLMYMGFCGALFIHGIDEVLIAMDRMYSFLSWVHHPTLVQMRLKVFQQLKMGFYDFQLSETEYQALAFGPFRTCNSVFTGSPYPEPQHAEFEKSEYKLVVIAIKKIQTHMKKVLQQWKLLDDNGVITKTTSFPCPYPLGDNHSWIKGQRLLVRESI